MFVHWQPLTQGAILVLPWTCWTFFTVNIWEIGIPIQVALAIVAMIGYLIGRRIRRRAGQLERGSAIHDVFLECGFAK